VNFVGHHLQHVKDHMLATAKSLEIPQAQFRVDPLSRAERDMNALKKLGLLGR
jgi:hypothetical protein